MPFDNNNAARTIEFLLFMTFKSLPSQRDLPLIAMLPVFWINTMQFQVSRSFGELHIHPAMGMAFPKVVTDRWLSNDMEMLLVFAVLPFMGVTVNVCSSMLSPGEYF